MQQVAQVLEILMLLAFGFSWPNNIINSLKNKSTKGKSLLFLCLIFFGYIAGIISKFVNEAYMNSFASKWYVLCFYILNLLMVGADLVLYYRNYRLDKARAAEETKA